MTYEQALAWVNAREAHSAERVAEDMLGAGPLARRQRPRGDTSAGGTLTHGLGRNREWRTIHKCAFRTKDRER